MHFCEIRPCYLKSFIFIAHTLTTLTSQRYVNLNVVLVA